MYMFVDTYICSMDIVASSWREEDEMGEVTGTLVMSVI